MSLWKENKQAISIIGMTSDNDDFFSYFYEGGVSDVMTKVQSLEYNLVCLS